MGTLRPATPAGAQDLTRLRGLMHLAMGAPSLTDEWRGACEDAFRRRLVRPDLTAYGLEVDGRLVSCAAGWLEGR